MFQSHYQRGTTKNFIVLLLFFTLGFSGCSSTRLEPLSFDNQTLQDYGFQEISTTLPLKIFNKEVPFVSKMHPRIYIESDGANWLLNTFQPSSPTPNRTFSASLAAKDTNSSVSYISRPCQFINSEQSLQCPTILWGKARFGPKAISIVDAAINVLKQEMGSSLSSKIELIGYSGGGVMATLLAAKRNDVSCLVTIAAPLDLDAWTNFHHVAPLDQSIRLTQLSAIELNQLQNTQQFHFYGTEDRNTPFQSVSRIQNLLGKKAQWLQILGFDHQNHWISAWSELINTTCLASSAKSMQQN